MKKLLSFTITLLFIFLNLNVKAEFFCNCGDGTKISENDKRYFCNGNCSGTCMSNGGSFDLGPNNCVFIPSKK